MERDLAAIQAKLDSLEQEADSIGTEHPDEAAVIRDRITQIQQIWEQLKQMVSINILELRACNCLRMIINLGMYFILCYVVCS